MTDKTRPLTDMANAIRFLSIDAINKAKSGHPGMPMGMADVVTVLFSHFLVFNPQQPHWPNRDRFILSNGHGSMLQYALLHLTGYDLSIEDIQNFRQLHSKTPGHPEYGYTPGVETTTGPLGQGLANAVGMAISQKIMAERYGEDLFDNKTYVVVGDGCLMEGVSHEALEIAGHLKLKNLVVLFDDNHISIDGETNLTSSTDIQKRIESYGFEYISADGHDEDDIFDALTHAEEAEKPTFIAFKTHIGFGSPHKQDSAAAHGSPLGEEERKLTANELNWPYAPFEIPSHIKEAWESCAEDGIHAYQNWMEDLEALNEKNPHKCAELLRTISNELPESLEKSLDELKIRTCTDKPELSTRKAGGNVVDVMSKVLPELNSGSADLSSSVFTKASDMHGITASDFSGRYIHYGVREHAMASIMNGMALYGGIIPISGTFMSFLDYLRPALRLSALMGLRVIYVMTHDSIGLGEDGPTHQPVEHLAICRATPNVLTFRPCDQVETIECYEIALRSTETPSVVSLSRQNLPTIRTVYGEENLCLLGAYHVVEGKKGKVQGIFMASGSEVEIAMRAHKALLMEGIETNVISVPCMELFDLQEESYKQELLPEGMPIVALEAGVKAPWEKYLTRKDIFIGVEDFGESAPAEELYEHFNLTAENAMDMMKSLIADSK